MTGPSRAGARISRHERRRAVPKGEFRSAQHEGIPVSAAPGRPKQAHTTARQGEEPPMGGVGMHPDWLLPRWPVAPHVGAVFTTRAGGISRPPFDSLNLGRPSDDDRAAVDSNRQRLQSAIGLAPVFLSQVHGVNAITLDAPPDPASDVAPLADASVTAIPGVVCTVRVADCLPVLFSDIAGRVVGAAHAGWRGLASGVLEANLLALQQLALRHCGEPLRPSDVVAWLGPCIGPQKFEVGPEVRAAFLQHDGNADSCFVQLPGAKWLADLPALARLRLLALGVGGIYGNDGSAPWCTVSNPLRFFSHRRDSRVLGGSGRMAACVWINRLR